MKIGVSLKINVSMIEKARLFQGNKGKYLDATVFIDVDQLDEYGNNGMITQDVSKEEKQQNVRGAILGNCKVFWNDSQSQPAQQSVPQQQAPQKQQLPPNQQGWGQVPKQQGQQATQKINPQEPTIDFDDDIPF